MNLVHKLKREAIADYSGRWVEEKNRIGGKEGKGKGSNEVENVRLICYPFQDELLVNLTCSQ